jgi:hypothetical protein
MIFLGSTIDFLSSSGDGRFGEGDEASSLNELGQVAFVFHLADGREGIALTEPLGGAVVPVTITITNTHASPQAFALEWTTMPVGSPVDLYRSVDLTSWSPPISTNNTSGSFTDTSLPGPKAFYIAVPARAPFP